MQKKIGIVLKHILDLVGERKLEPPAIRECISESDDDY